MPAITIELDDETLDLLRKARASAVADMPARAPWLTDTVLADRVIKSVLEALAARGQDGLQANTGHAESLSAAVSRGDIDARTAEIIRGQIRDYRSVFDRLAE